MPDRAFIAYPPADSSSAIGGFAGEGQSVVNAMSTDPAQKELIKRVMDNRREVAVKSEETRSIAGSIDVPAGSSSATPAAAVLTRHVVRKATMDLVSKDVRVTASKAAFLVNEAAGEYIESSNLFGQDQQASAQLTIRVVASRLSEVLNQLRELGTVVSETSGGQDVTEQVIDIEARLRNEASVEHELLKLLASRESAPLTEVLQLREQINASRDRIERLTAQRDGIYRLTTLATVLVSIHHDAVPQTPATSGWWSGLRTNITDAGADGLRTLSGAIAFIVWAVLAGLVWWILLLVLGLGIWRWRGRVLKARATEVPPVV
jgi:hypothetical protein